MTSQSKALAYGLTTVLLWSTVASAFKLSLRHLHPVELLLWATVASFLTLFTALSYQGKLRGITNIPARQLFLIGGLGLLNPFLYYLMLFAAYDLLPAQQAQPLNYTWAITLALLSVPFLGQKLKVPELMAILLAYVGVVVISTRGDLLHLGFTNIYGVILALASTLVWSAYWILNTRSSIDPVIALFLNFLFALPLIMLTAYYTTGLNWPPTPGLAGAVYVGVFEMGIAFILWLKAMKLTNSTARLASLIYFSPFISLILIHYLVGEVIHWSSMAGLVLIVAGTVLQQLFHRAHKT